MKQTVIEAGKIRNTHALRGEVKIECYLDGDRPLRAKMTLYPSPDAREGYVIDRVRAQGDVYLVHFCGIDTVEAATLLKGKTLWASREEIDPDGTRIFFADLIGTPLTDPAGQRLGVVEAVENRGARELLVIQTPAGETRYFPMVREWIHSMDAETGLVVSPPEGLLN